MSSEAAGHDRALGEHRTVSRVMAIIERVLASEPSGMRLADVAISIDAPKSSIHGLCKGLVATGYLREDSGRYFLGPAISSLLAAGNNVLPAAYRSALQELTERWGETALLVTLVGDSIVYVAKEEPDTMVRASPPTNTRFPMWPRSSGKVFLAYMEPRRRNAFLERTFRDPAERESARREVEAIPATRITSRIEGAEAGVATPVIFRGLPVNTALSIVGPAERMRGKTELIAEDLLKTAQTLSNEVSS
ncbi:helix-turn-helix domain-containing protein [Gordonia sp. zg691]|uniref:Helix-turn-helix domain-containing protein n=1 Tax=Gordonia jinghuaiqii TaxID=2758710 RepID=A0A7D7R1M9_9ACTN|nr:helix-turn-helix domain-containing protein [Gordonia jinghuaiqii]MBD0863462.1 helix-turn-helix domain-containing protein [Gordonia jinghuaiqii]MCR5979193.1 helix-turn-helix domain-containing protein [Gordonia jinghuaiqii]QMT00987.1 helix-turn-helix domain-containing protein [Gordonia jinghuaiqii]